MHPADALIVFAAVIGLLLIAPFLVLVFDIIVFGVTLVGLIAGSIWDAIVDMVGWDVRIRGSRGG